MQRSSFAILFFLSAVGANGQSKPAIKRPATHRTPLSSKPKYLKIALDLTVTSLGSNFAGHGIVAIIEAVKNSPALQEKSEYESTPAFLARQAAFVNRPIYASMTSNASFGFVFGDRETVALKYDADSHIERKELADESIPRERSTFV